MRYSTPTHTNDQPLIILYIKSEKKCLKIDIYDDIVIYIIVFLLCLFCYLFTWILLSIFVWGVAELFYTVGKNNVSTSIEREQLRK